MRCTSVRVRNALLIGFMVCLVALICPRVASADEPKSAESADAMLKQIEVLAPPSFDSGKREDQEYTRSFMQQRTKWAQEKAELEGKFLAAYPDHPKAATIRMERWRL